MNSKSVIIYFHYPHEFEPANLSSHVLAIVTEMSF